MNFPVHSILIAELEGAKPWDERSTNSRQMSWGRGNTFLWEGIAVVSRSMLRQRISQNNETNK